MRVVSVVAIKFAIKFANVETIMEAPGHKLVSPEGVLLHLLPVDDRSILAFTKVHGIQDKTYLMKHLRGEQDESYGSGKRLAAHVAAAREGQVVEALIRRGNPGHRQGGTHFRRQKLATSAKNSYIDKYNRTE